VTSPEKPQRTLTPRQSIVASVLILVIGAGTALLAVTVKPPSTFSEPGVRMDLPLDAAGFSGEEGEASTAELRILPADTEFEKVTYTSPEGDSINCQIVLAGAQRTSIHRPQECLPAQGWRIENSEVLPIQLNDGRTLKVTNLTIVRPVEVQPGVQKELRSYFMYWFMGHDVNTPSHYVRVARTSLDRLLSGVNHRWAYVIVSAAVMDDFRPGAKNAEETLAMLKDFIPEIYPEIEKQADE